MPVWQATVAWCILGAGAAFSSRYWGHIADKHGQRPVLILTVCGKPLIVLLFLFATPATAFPLLCGWFFFDGILTAGLLMATDGYMLRMAPQRNRSMFIATIIGLAGISGGLGAILGGQFLSAFSECRPMLLGREWNHFQILFAFSFIIRIFCIPLTLAIREAKSSNTIEVLEEIGEMSALSFLKFPLGLYRRMQTQTKR